MTPQLEREVAIRRAARADFIAAAIVALVTAAFVLGFAFGLSAPGW